jgi:signal transduction histidine kinase
VVSHEIRTPLTSIKGGVELLSDPRYFKNDEKQTKLLTIAHANTERLLVLINDILDFSKIESSSLRIQREPHPVGPVIATATENLKTLLSERHIDLRVLVAPDLPEVYIDPDRISQVLTNLLSNAIKFSPDSGRIEVSATALRGSVRIGVKDHGEGIAPGNMSKLFQKFSQIDPSATRKAGGTGLGLVISKGIVEQHGGSIWVDSTPGHGSTFYFTIPIADESVRDAVA